MFSEITHVYFDRNLFVLTVEPPFFLHKKVPALQIQVTINDFNKSDGGYCPSLLWLKKSVVDKMSEAWGEDIWVGANKVRFVRSVKDYMTGMLPVETIHMRTIHVSAENYYKALNILNAAFPDGL